MHEINFDKSLFNIFLIYRFHQSGLFNNHVIFRSSSMWDKDLYKTSSHIFDVKDAITRNNNGPINSTQINQLLPEEKKLPPRLQGSENHESLFRDDHSAQLFSWSPVFTKVIKLHYLFFCMLFYNIVCIIFIVSLISYYWIF